MAGTKAIRTAARPKPKLDASDDVLESAIEYVISGHPAPRVEKVGELRLPAGSVEVKRCKAIRAIINDYAERIVSRPLSFAVFGPPGSGKSFCVREIVKAAGCRKPFVINLSQLSTPKELAENLKGHLDTAAKLDDTIRISVGPEFEMIEAVKAAAAELEAANVEAAKAKVFFFDEFDAPLGGESLGWLRWFLAPMQDGKFFLGPDVIEVGKAIFMFAGGTALSLLEFEKRAREYPLEYRDKKVPDFISRLRGYIDIEGVNGVNDEGIVRRELVLHRFLDDRWPGVREAHGGKFPISKDTTTKLLSNIHYVHGVRSIEALLDMSSLRPARTDAMVELPKDELKKLHLSRGPLDGKIIGISAGQEDSDAEGLLKDLADKLLKYGATLAYGGDFVPKGTMSMLIDAAKRVPDNLVEREDKRIRNYLAFPSFKRGPVAKLLALEEKKKEKEKLVDIIQLDTLSESEIKSLDVPSEKWFRARNEKKPKKYKPSYHLAWAISLFRMRARLVQDIDALIVLGGKDDGKSWGRFSGIAEEAMLALALGKPLYVLGGLGGGAKAVGQLLGLDSIVPDPNTCLVDEELEASFSKHEFTLPGFPDLPQTTSKLRCFLFEHGITTQDWPRNGLLPEENRQLFETRIRPNKIKDSVQCVDLVIAGLLRLDWKTPAQPPL
jgi:SLOG cluster2/AAA domain